MWRLGHCHLYKNVFLIIYLNIEKLIKEVDDIFTLESIILAVIVLVVSVSVTAFIFVQKEKSNEKKGLSKIKNAEEEAKKILEEASKNAEAERK